MPRGDFAVAFKVCVNYIKERGSVRQAQTRLTVSLDVVGAYLPLVFLSLPEFFSPVHK
jgi:hypothetical protein